VNDVDPRDDPTAGLDHLSAAGRPAVQRLSRELSLVEFSADDPRRARRFWSGLLGIELDAREADEGHGWQNHGAGPSIGVHERGRGPGDTFSLPYFSVEDLDLALEHVVALGGTVIHPGPRWAICKDSEGSPFGLALDPAVS
jgi:predicted enzyme related to lactoylglutathione lyase